MSLSITKKILFCSVPFSNLDQIYSAPAILKGVVVQHGFSAQTVDFGCQLLNQVNKDVSKFDQVQTYFISASSGDDYIHKSEIAQFYQNCIEFFKNNPSEFIGISVLSIFSHKAVFDLCSMIKKSGITSKIVIGGRGAKVSVFSNAMNHMNMSTAEKFLEFGAFLKKRKLIDHMIIGDGEDAILSLLDNIAISSENLESENFRSPIPDYSDYNFSDYLFDNEIMLPVTGSKGCVRDCDFCDVKKQFGKYRYRSGSDIANELIEVSNKFNIHKFQFTDSLVNGGLKPFREFLEAMSCYNLANPNKKITWNGQYICRPFNDVPWDLYQLMHNAGAHGLTIGAESGSNRVLEAMNKKTTVEALLLELENFRKYNITCVLLTFVGHWSETWEDFVEHCKMFVKIAPYVRSGTISAVSLGFPFMLINGTPAMHNHDMNNIVIGDNFEEYLWLNKSNRTNTFKERVYRRIAVHELCKKLNIPTVADSETILHLLTLIETLSDQINEFFENS